MLQKLRGLPGLLDVNSDQQDKGLQAGLVIDRATVSRLGVSTRAIDDTLYDAFGQRQLFDHVHLRAAQQSLAVTTNQYQAGIVSCLNVVVAQRTALTNESTAVDILGRRLNACVLLVKALGGGWKVS
jgi:multidrug efflux pump subunit AcrB